MFQKYGKQDSFKYSLKSQLFKLLFKYWQGFIFCALVALTVLGVNGPLFYTKLVLEVLSYQNITTKTSQDNYIEQGL